MPKKKRRFRPKPPPRPMQSIFASLGRSMVMRILWSCLGLIALGMAFAILLFGKVPEPDPIPTTHIKTLDVGLMFLAWLGISSLSFVAWQVAMHEVHAWGQKPIRILWNAGLVFLNAAVILLVVDVFILRLSGQDWSALGFRRMSWGWVLGSIGLGVVSMLLSGVVAALVMHKIEKKWVNPQENFIMPTEQSTTTVAMEEPTKEEKAKLSIPGALAMIMLVGVAVPIVEEMLFRGVLYTWMVERMPVIAAVVLSALVFGIAHFESGRPVVAACFVGGIFMAVAFHYSHSLYAPIIVHSVNNLTKVVLTYVLRSDSPA